MKRLTSKPGFQSSSRNIAKLLRKLAQPGASIVQQNDCQHPNKGEGNVWRLRKNQSGARKDGLKWPHHFVIQLQSEDLIQKCKHDGWQISGAGKSWLKRHLAGSDPFQAQQMCVVRKAIEVRGVHAVTAVNMAESPLAWLRQRGGKAGVCSINDAQFAAGERLHSDFTRAHMTPRITSDWGAAPNSANRRTGDQGGTANLLDSVIEAGRRYNRAIQAVGPELSDVLIDVCCFLKGLEETERTNRWPRRSAKLVLQMALTRLARHYGLETHAAGASRSAKGIKKWGTEDYRPKIDG